jgi:hypothetical protein
VAKYTGFGKGYTGFPYHVTGGHEAEAEAAERARPPNRFGMWILRRFGFQEQATRTTPGGPPRMGVSLSLTSR